MSKEIISLDGVVGKTPITFITSAGGGKRPWDDCNDRRFWPVDLNKSEARKCDNCGEFGECCQKQKHGEPLFWYRPRSDGFYEGPIHNAQIETVRKECGAWVPLYTAQQRKPQFKEFIKWADAQGYDCAQTCNSDTGEWICLNPMTADLWKAWQAAHGIKAGGAA